MISNRLPSRRAVLGLPIVLGGLLSGAVALAAPGVGWSGAMPRLAAVPGAHRGAAPGSAAQAQSVADPVAERLGSSLARLAAVDRVSRAAGQRVDAATTASLPADLRAQIQAGVLRLDRDGSVQVYVAAASGPEEVVAGVRRHGGRIEIEEPESGLVQAWVPVAVLEALAVDPTVRRVRLPDYAVANTGFVTSQGDAILRAATLRSTTGVDGTGVRVGVISDGVGGLETAKSSGDLPAAVDITTCNSAGGDPRATGAEGTAMLEIVHDLAPGAQLWFGNFGFSTTLAFNAAVKCLAKNVDVVVDDISFLNAGPYDGTSSVSKNSATQLATDTNRERTHITAVGNMADRHYQDTFTPSNFIVTVNGVDRTLHQFRATADTSDAGSGLPCASGSSEFCGNRLLLQKNGTASVFLEWNDPFGAASDDYDLFLLDEATGKIVASGADVQHGSGNPVERLSWTNTHAAGFFSILIGKRSGLARTLDLFLICSGCTAAGNGTLLNFNTAASSVANQADAGGDVLAAGAIGAADPGHDTIEPFSSRGPTNDGRVKPDITGIDGVAVTGAGGFSTPFFGTSAAAPHIAGIAALLLELEPSLRSGGLAAPAAARTALRTALLTGAVDLGTAGTDNTFGAGRADAPGAAQALIGLLGSCVASDTTLCIDDAPGDQRFEVKVSLRVSPDAPSGLGHAISLASVGVEHGGLFWFFTNDNPEMLVKVINACSQGGRFWVFYAAGTNVGLTTTVRDTRTGQSKVYVNPDGTAAAPVQDTSGLICTLADTAAAANAPTSLDAAALARSAAQELAAARTTSALNGSNAVACIPDATTLCIDGRFKVQVAYQTVQGGGLFGKGQAIPLTSLGVDQGGIFWFFDAGNPEMLFKILDGCALNGSRWVFFSAGTNVGLVVTVTDVVTSASKTYTNADLHPATPVQDTAALPCN